MNQTWYQIKILSLRERYRIRHYFWGEIINTTFFWPIMFALGSGYIAPLCYFGRADAKMATMLFVGMLLLQLMVMSHTYAMIIMRERTASPVIQHQAISTLLPLVYCVRYVFYSSWTAFRLLPFFPVSKLVLCEFLYTDHLSWGALAGMIILGSFLSTAYSCFLSSMVSNMTEAGSLWERYIEPLIWLGGMWVPLFAMMKTSKTLGLITLLNPFLYVTEAVRGLFFQDALFIPLTYCLSAITLAITVLLYGSYHLFRRRLDAV